MANQGMTRPHSAPQVTEEARVERKEITVSGGAEGVGSGPRQGKEGSFLPTWSRLAVQAALLKVESSLTKAAARRLFDGTVRSQWWAFSLVLATLQLAIHSISLAHGSDHIATALFQDDTFYFLQTAWNAHKFGFVTFDGINPTNGVQLLWWVVVWLLSWPLQSKSALVMAVGITGALINAAAHPVIHRIGRELEAPHLAGSASVLWFALTLASPTYMRGMDNALHGLIVWCLVWQLARFAVRHTTGKATSLLPLTVVLILNVWARLDSVLVSAAIFVCCVAFTAGQARVSRARLRFWVRDLVLSGTTAIAGGLIQAVSYRLMDESILPVSALWKSPQWLPSSHDRFGDAFVDMIWRGFIDVGFPVINFPPWLVTSLSLLAVTILAWLFRSGNEGRWRVVTAAVSVFVLGALGLSGAWIPEIYLGLVALLVMIWLRRAGMDDTTRALFLTWSTLTVAFLAYNSGSILLGMRPRYYSTWYQAPAHVYWIIASCLAVDTITVMARDRSLRLGLRIGGSMLLCFVFVTGFVRGFVGYLPHDLFVADQRAARWIASTDPGENRYAAWNAGLLGYYCDCTLVNLDGLVNSVAYFESRKKPGACITDYLRNEEIEFVVDWIIPEDVRPDLIPLAVFPTRPEWVPVTVYRVTAR